MDTQGCLQVVTMLLSLVASEVRLAFCDRAASVEDTACCAERSPLICAYSWVALGRSWPIQLCDLALMKSRGVVLKAVNI